ncbi:MAG: hypothetical protein H3C35_09865, partial [Bacteroidetes bacterium]|nr:hypothetical protein [Bacteroidota bacterium]
STGAAPPIFYTKIRTLPKAVIALFVDGLDVKFAHLSFKNNTIKLREVRTVNLLKRLEERALTESGMGGGGESFDLMETFESSGRQDTVIEGGGSQSNSEVMISLLSEYPTSAYKFVYSISEPSIYYQTFEDSFGLTGGKLKKKLIEELGETRSVKPSDDSLNYIQAAEGQILTIIREDGLSLLELIQGIKDFLGGRLPRVEFIETSDISLINIVRANYELGESEISLIVYVGSEFSRLIFMKGDHFFHFAPVISEGRLTPNIENTLYSRILLEQDSAGILRIDRVFLAGESHKIDLRTFLTPQFAEAPIEYISASSLDTSLFEEQPEAIVSEYAIPIAAAMRVFQQKNNLYYHVDLLPASFRESQKIFKLAWHGYILLVLIFMSTLFFTNRFVGQGENLRRARAELQRKEEQLAENQRLQAILDSVTVQNQSYTAALSVYDQIVPNYNRWSKIFYHLTNSVEMVNAVWIKDITAKADGTIELIGYSVYRERIPKIVTMFESATLQSVDIETIRGKDVYRFLLLIKKIDAEQ